MMLIWSQEAFISALGLSLAHSLWQGALVGAVAVALHSRLKRATAEVRYAACGLLLLTLVVAWLGSLACLYAAEARATAPPVAAVQFAALSPLPPAASAPHGSPLQPRTLRSFAPLLVLLWTLGVSLLSIRHLSSLLALWRLQRVGTTPCPPEWQARIKVLAGRMGLRQKVRVLLSPRVDVPLTFGVLKSYLLLPPSVLMGLSAEQLEALIAHELAHIRQHDTLVNMLQIWVETLLFYHPVVWWLSAQMRVAREQRCDDLAVRIVGDHALYARALLTMEELRAPIPHLALGATGGNSHMSNHHLIQRIQRVLGVHGPEKRAPWMAGALALCTAAIGLGTLWPVQAHSAPTPRAHHPSLAKRADGQQTVTTNTHGSWSMGLGTSVNGKSIGVKFDSKTPDLTPDYPITIDGQQKRFEDLSADEQEQLSMIVADARKGADQRLRDQSADTPQAPGTVNGQPNKQPNEAVAPSKNASISKVMGAKQGSTADNEQRRSATAVRQKVYQLKVGNGQAKVLGDTLKPDTIVIINGVRSRFKDLSAARQKQIRAAWSHDHRLPHL